MELLRGLFTSLTKGSDAQHMSDRIHAILRPEALQLSYETGIHLHIQLVRLLLHADLGNWDSLGGEFLNGISRLLQAAFNTADAPFRSSASDTLLEAHVNLLGRLIIIETSNSGPMLDLVWLLIGRLASVVWMASANSTWQTAICQLMAQVLHRIDDSLKTTARLGMPEMCNSISILAHPISATLLLINAQHVTEQIESFARFLHRMLVWNLGDQTAHFTVWNNSLLSKIERQLGDESLWVLRLCFTVAFTGMCLPEWSTAEPCIKLATTVLQRVAHAPALDKAALVTPTFLFETHCNLVLIFTKGALPRRLITKFADLYAALSQFVPDKQFALLAFILDCAQTSVAEWEYLAATPPHQGLLSHVRRAVEKTNVSERHKFVSTVTRGFVRIKIVADSIAAFSTSCTQNPDCC
ncbi:unnamed protein product [Echinostoma caproni]|uniref:Uncharacterized protein n=1 Tax=Echinostoma caproni TaxID=27848 RepID=A0A183AY36_9TREM|nr:unnamed protein product [Echinostoma caproni]